MVHADEGAVEPELLGRDRELDRLHERVGAVCVCDPAAACQCPKERNPMRFTVPTVPPP